MNQLPKFKNLPAPDDYFERLPDQIMAKAFPKKSKSWKPYAAAAAVLLSLGISWQMGWISSAEQPLSPDAEANLYIDSQVWTAEDVLSLADDPNALLDQIIEEEMPTSEEIWLEDGLTWY